MGRPREPHQVKTPWNKREIGTRGADRHSITQELRPPTSDAGRYRQTRGATDIEERGPQQKKGARPSRPLQAPLPPPSVSKPRFSKMLLTSGRWGAPWSWRCAVPAVYIHTRPAPARSDLFRRGILRQSWPAVAPAWAYGFRTTRCGFDQISTRSNRTCHCFNNHADQNQLASSANFGVQIWRLCGRVWAFVRSRSARFQPMLSHINTKIGKLSSYVRGVFGQIRRRGTFDHCWAAFTDLGVV